MALNDEPAQSGNNLENKIIVILREDLEPWKRLNVTAFMVSGIAANGNVGEPYKDASGKEYLPMFNEPVMVYGADAAQLKRAAERAISRDVRYSIFTEELFNTFNDIDNRAAVAKVANEKRRTRSLKDSNCYASSTFHGRLCPPLSGPDQLREIVWRERIKKGRSPKSGNPAFLDRVVRLRLHCSRLPYPSHIIFRASG